MGTGGTSLGVDLPVASFEGSAMMVERRLKESVGHKRPETISP